MTEPAALPGHAVTETELREAGFVPHELRFGAGDVALPGGLGREWATLGTVPEGPGLYAFTVTDAAVTTVTYVGRTEHLWMVTKGYLPRGAGARGGNRYGKPRHAGATRQRVNILIAEQVAAGRRVRHWLRPTSIDVLDAQERAFIERWRLREVGWNRR